MKGFCECGCGQRTRPARQTLHAKGQIKGEPVRFVRGHRTLGTVGYTVRSRPGHHRANGNDCVLEHLLIVEEALGKRLPVGAEVHHVDGNMRNNAKSNLVICQDRAYHKLLHFRTRIVRAGGDPDTQRVCSRCRRVLPVSEFWKSKTNSGTQTACKTCNNAYRRERRKQRQQTLQETGA